MKKIETLIKDIYDVVGSDEGWFTEAVAQDFSRELGLRLVENLRPKDALPTLRLSGMGKKCPRQLWHSIRTPLDAVPIQPRAKIMFSYGHILEALLITLAKAAGHEVTGEQDELSVDGVLGHRDCVIDGNIVDIKSTTSLGFEKFKTGSIKNDDLFGYLDQLDGYVVGSSDDPLVRNKRSGYLLAIDKSLGKLALYEHIARPESIRQRIRDYRAIVEAAGPPPCTCETVPDGKSGNIKLGVVASYSPFRYCCHPQLRCFLYANGPVYLTKVVRKPDVPEVDKFGKIVYN